eukprot:364887-Chlamydomonas_euryale.AAC.3
MACAWAGKQCWRTRVACLAAAWHAHGQAVKESKDSRWPPLLIFLLVHPLCPAPSVSLYLSLSLRKSVVAGFRRRVPS